jgi:hypothetical protein
VAGRPSPGFPSDSTLPLLAAFVLALAFLGVVVAIGLGDSSSARGKPVASSTTTQQRTPLLADEVPVLLLVSTAGDGQGTVRVNGEPHDCSNDCRFKFPRDDTVRLVAREAAGSTFVGWTGNCEGGRTCDQIMDGPRSVTALFGKKTPPPAETAPTTECDDGLDNDGDGLVDGEDGDCLIGETEDPGNAVPPPPPPIVPQPVVPQVPVVPPPPPPPPPPVVEPPPPPPPPPLSPPVLPPE